MMRKWLNPTFKTKLIGSFAILLLVPSLTIGLLSYRSAEGKVKEEILHGADNTIGFLSNAIESLIQPKTEQIGYFARELKANPDELQQSKKRLEQYQALHSEIFQAYIGSESGEFITAPDTQIPEGYDPRKRDWYQEAMSAGGQPIITDPYEDAGSHSIVVSIAKALEDGSGVVGFDLSLNKLRELTDSYRVGKEGFAYILDQSGKMIAHPSLSSGDQAGGELYGPLYASASGQYEHGDRGQEALTKFVTHELTGWKIAGTMFQSEIKREVQPIFQTTFVVVTISLLAGAAVIVLIILSLLGPIRAIMRAADKISEGDLTERIELRSNDEMGKLGARFNQMADSLSAVILGVRQTVDQLAASSEQLSASSHQTSQAAEHIAHSVQDVAESAETQVRHVAEGEQSIEQFSQGVRQISNNSYHVAASAQQSSELAAEGSESLGSAVRQMNVIHRTIVQVSEVVQGLGNRSREIGQIVGEITGIASQTNLLALNAAIEASRAGEHGRGFAVVAQEVRKLAEQSAHSADKISQLIASIIGETRQAVDSIELGTREVAAGMSIVNDADESFQRIRSSVQDVSGQIQEVSAASQQMSASTEQLVRASEMIKKASMDTAYGAESISSASEQQLASMEEITASAAHLSSMALELQDMVSKFRI